MFREGNPVENDPPEFPTVRCAVTVLPGTIALIDSLQQVCGGGRHAPSSADSVLCSQTDGCKWEIIEC